MPPENEASWASYQKLIVSELDRHNRILEALGDKLSNLKAEIATRNELPALKSELAEYKSNVQSELATLKAKAGGWGAIAGALAALVPIIMMLLLNFLQVKPHP